MTVAVHHPNEATSNADRDLAARFEPKSLRTYTSSQAVLAKSAGVFHWTPEGRKLFDFSSGVLVNNLGHNSVRWMRRFVELMGWGDTPWQRGGARPAEPYFTALPLNAYNAVTPLETQASMKLTEVLHGRPGGKRLQQVMWAASGSEAIQKALWAALARDHSRDMIIATRYGFHGKKGLSHAVTGSELDHDRDPRVRFISFPMKECIDVTVRDEPLDPAPYLHELEALKYQFGRKLSVLITEPYLGGGGSYHPPKRYLQLLQQFCRDNDIVFILDEVQANFGRTGHLFAFETYGLEPDVVVLGKGLGNGVPVSAAVGSTALFGTLEYGEGSDTWSANSLGCAAVLASLEEYVAPAFLDSARRSSAIIEQGLLDLKEFPFVAHVRGEKGGMVWGIEMRDHGRHMAAEWANAVVCACYRGEGSAGIHILGPLAKKVLRIAPPLTITETESHEALALMHRILATMAAQSARELGKVPDAVLVGSS
jgi:4-aminobutyrate aminotransferase-like enzyme